MDLQEQEEENNEKDIHGGHWGINPSPPSKTPLPLFPKPPLNQQTAKPPFLGNPPYILVFCDSPKSPVKPPLFQNLVEDSPPAPPHPPPYSRYPL